MTRHTRPSHAKGHPNCPFKSWAACDKAVQMRFGQCIAVTGDREPVPCTRWAVAKNGWCWQHYASEAERIKREEHIAIRKTRLNAVVDEFIAWSKGHPSVWDTKKRPDEAPKRKGPHRLDVSA